MNSTCASLQKGKNFNKEGVGFPTPHWYVQSQTKRKEAYPTFRLASTQAFTYICSD